MCAFICSIAYNEVVVTIGGQKGEYFYSDLFYHHDKLLRFSVLCHYK